jgi:hypothetical protein
MGKDVMNSNVRTRQARCFLVYALAPDRLSAAKANNLFNQFVADGSLPLTLFHDHFIGKVGGLAIFYVSSEEERDALLKNQILADWDVQFHPLIFSRSPSAFDEQIAFTLKTYRGENWELLQKEVRPSYGNPGLEADTALETPDDEIYRND